MRILKKAISLAMVTLVLFGISNCNNSESKSEDSETSLETIGDEMVMNQSMDEWNGTFLYPTGEPLSIEYVEGNLFGSFSDGSDADIEISSDGVVLIDGSEAFLANDTIFYTINAAGSSRDTYLIRKKRGGGNSPIPTFPSTSIGDQVWAVENLNVDQFRNGDKITQARNIQDWEDAETNKTPIWSYYDFNDAYGAKYGKLYNLYAVIDPRGLPPNGWHVPSVEEINILIGSFGGETTAGKSLKATQGWNRNGNGTNQSNFNGLAGGEYATGKFQALKEFGRWWTSDQRFKGGGSGMHFGLSYQSNRAYVDIFPAYCGLSVRCIKDAND
ncbi:MAG: fibrobacter succinogenes major paralogous domain-containing protein [Cyclobacteriaceae bacterium]